MDVREKLVEIIQNSVGGCARHWAEVIADGLIVNGVTVQERIVDAVEVVRCMECKFRSSWMMNRNLRYICPESGMFPNGENDFCSYGKRKEGAD